MMSKDETVTISSALKSIQDKSRLWAVEIDEFLSPPTSQGPQGGQGQMVWQGQFHAVNRCEGGCGLLPSGHVCEKAHRAGSLENRDAALPTADLGTSATNAARNLGGTRDGGL